MWKLITLAVAAWPLITWLRKNRRERRAHA
jgi:hypothetical protein